MSSDYSLTAYTNVLGDHERIRALHLIPSVAASWERSVALQGGDWMGKFVLSGLPFQELIEIFNTWLGYDIQEQHSGGGWGGMVYEMALHHNLIRRISLEPMVNKVRASYKELLENGGFELSGLPPTGWAYNAGGGGAPDTVAFETTRPGQGAQSIKFTQAGGATTAIQQTVVVLPNRGYRLKFYTSGDGTRQGRYLLFDMTNGTQIIPTTDTGVTSSGGVTIPAYRNVSLDFITPPNCVSLRVSLFESSANGSVYYDDVSLQLLQESEPVEQMTPAAEEVASQNRYGLKEAILHGNHELSIATAVRDKHLAQHAWPITEREEGHAGDEPYLEVTVCGYTFTQKWIISTLKQHGARTAASALVISLLAECQFVAATAISANSYTIGLDDSEKTGRDALVKVVDAGDGAGNPWRLYMNYARTATYEPISNEPVYHLRSGKFYGVGNLRNAVSSRELRPGVVRDMDYPVSGKEPGSWFQDRRDFLLDEISVAADGSLRWGIAEV